MRVANLCRHLVGRGCAYIVPVRTAGVSRAGCVSPGSLEGYVGLRLMRRHA